MAPKTNWIKIVMIGFVLCFYLLIVVLEGMFTDWKPLPGIWAIVFFMVNFVLAAFVWRACARIWRT